MQKCWSEKKINFEAARAGASRLFLSFEPKTRGMLTREKPNSWGIQWGSIRCKRVIRWQHLSQIKARLFWIVENVFFLMKTQQAISETSAATCKLMEPHWLNSTCRAIFIDIGGHHLFFISKNVCLYLDLKKCGGLGWCHCCGSTRWLSDLIF